MTKREMSEVTEQFIADSLAPETQPPVAGSANGSAALGEKKWNVICTLLEAAKPSYESGDDEQHRAYCQAIGILIRKWQP